MSVASFFEKVVGLQQQHARATATGYRELVAAIASGREPAATEVQHVLASVGKSVDELRKDVDRQQTRAGLRALMNSLPKFETERRALDSQIAAADRELAVAEKRHEDTTAPLFAARRDIDLAIAEAERASNILVQSCDDADLLREMNELNAEARRLDEQYRNQVDRANYMEEKVRSERNRAEHELTLGDTEARREVAERYHKEAESARRDVKRLEKARADIAKRRERLEHRMRQA